MRNLIITVIITALLMLLALLGLAIGWMVSGKSLKRGSCGYNPAKKNNKKGFSCSEYSCELCSPEEFKKED